MSKFVLPLSDYNRIYQVVHGVLQGRDDIRNVSALFAIVGALVLKQHYGILARPVAGGFALCVEPGKNLILGRDAEGKVEYDADVFHMWVETRTHILDFSAPTYPEMAQAAGFGVTVPCKMFQKKVEEEAPQIETMYGLGDFVAYPDHQLSEKLLDGLTRDPAYAESIKLATQWFGRRRQKQMTDITYIGGDGAEHSLSLPNTQVRGSW